MAQHFNSKGNKKNGKYILYQKTKVENREEKLITNKEQIVELVEICYTDLYERQREALQITQIPKIETKDQKKSSTRSQLKNHLVIVILP